MNDKQETQLTPAKSYGATVLRCAEEASRSLPLSIPKADLQRAWDRLSISFKSAAMRNNDLYQCYPPSIGDAVVQCALTGLYPGGALADVYLVPRYDKHIGGKVLNLQISYRGYMKMAARVGVRLQPVAVMAGDHFKVIRGMSPNIEHEQRESPSWDSLVAVYVVAFRGPVPVGFEVMDRAQIIQRRKQAQSQKFWNAWPVEMALKTGIRYAISRGLVLLDEQAAAAFTLDLAATEKPIDAVSAPVLASGSGSVSPGVSQGLDTLLALTDAQEEPEKGSPPVGGGE